MAQNVTSAPKVLGDASTQGVLVNPALDSAALGVLLLSLKTLSQRTLVALGNLLTIASVASVWWLFNEALPANPSVNQLVGLGLYGAFVLAVHRVAGRLV